MISSVAVKKDWVPTVWADRKSKHLAKVNVAMVSPSPSPSPNPSPNPSPRPSHNYNPSPTPHPTNQGNIDLACEMLGPICAGLATWSK